ncbi:NAD(P)-dependent oxidoreductase [Paracoccaceae bacterium]|jgi:uronate dehydrogenase|nr:NAD(P)-dependent oxidoreductase [Paracoccaceae bacterium]MDC1254647.1 NAD(P)-dependent oxidoreductase [Paracoccaceae bacterium]|tara:strand:- start:742 stop:1578 length:837 start_codon:yes stop_codon:yes gene_type:complete
MKKLVLTGAAGRLGSYLREPLSELCDNLVSTDLVEGIGSTYSGETYIKADLANFDEVNALMDGAEMIVHFGALSDEDTFDEILSSNIIGAYNVWEAAARNHVNRVIYASSIHAVGMYPKNEYIGINVPHRPDTFYGLAKCFAEDLASLYWDKKQVEAVCLRILSCAKVTSSRALGSWLSYDDLILLVKRAIDAPTTGFSIIYGVSNNDRTPVDNSEASFLGYKPKDNAEQYADKILKNANKVDKNDRAQIFHGGPFAAVELGQSGKAIMQIVDDKKIN